MTVREYIKQYTDEMLSTYKNVLAKEYQQGKDFSTLTSFVSRVANHKLGLKTTYQDTQYFRGRIYKKGYTVSRLREEATQQVKKQDKEKSLVLKYSEKNKKEQKKEQKKKSAIQISYGHEKPNSIYTMIYIVVITICTYLLIMYFINS